MDVPAQQAAKITRPLMPAAAPAVLLLSRGTQQGVPSIILAMTRRDFVKPAFSLRQKPLRENTCPIASGDYSTPVSQRMCQSGLWARAGAFDASRERFAGIGVGGCQKIAFSGRGANGIADFNSQAAQSGIITRLALGLE
jgi:hypothetical protein